MTFAVNYKEEGNMPNNFKKGIFSLLLAFSAVLLTAMPSLARRYYFEQPVFVDPYAYGAVPLSWSAPAYIAPERPFSLHRFLGHAIGDTLGLGGGLLFSPFGYGYGPGYGPYFW